MYLQEGRWQWTSFLQDVYLENAQAWGFSNFSVPQNHLESLLKQIAPLPHPCILSWIRIPSSKAHILNTLRLTLSCLLASDVAKISLSYWSMWLHNLTFLFLLIYFLFYFMWLWLFFKYFFIIISMSFEMGAFSPPCSIISSEKSEHVFSMLFNSRNPALGYLQKPRDQFTKLTLLMLREIPQ